MIIVVGGDDLKVCGALWDQLMVEWKIDCLNCVGVVEISYGHDLTTWYLYRIEIALPGIVFDAEAPQNPESPKPRSHRCCFWGCGDCKRLAC